jgi:hypothetical protein
MEGLFIDSNHHLQIVVNNATSKQEWVVYYNDGETDSIKMLIYENGSVFLDKNEDEDEKVGVSEKDTIVWSDGVVWTRVNVSYAQWQFMTRRPYVPMTLILFSLFYDFYMFSKTFLAKRFIFFGKEKGVEKDNVSKDFKHKAGVVEKAN